MAKNHLKYIQKLNRNEMNLFSKSDHGHWDILETKQYAQKGISWNGAPFKRTGLIYVLKHSKTGEIKFKKIILSRAAVYDANNPLVKEVLSPEATSQNV
ncbi:MAG: hypothetical protein PHX80_04640 [Candidatus Nanoarchaeia archaeon]|nr:hypothetical protein [Candidatus Nanoarchaeia archaeon]